MDPLTVPIYTVYPHKPDAVGLLGLSESTIKNLIARGELESVREGGRRLVVVESIRDYVDRKRAESGGEAA